MTENNNGISRRAVIAGLGMAGLSLGLGSAAAGGVSLAGAVNGSGNGRGNGNGNGNGAGAGRSAGTADCVIIPAGSDFTDVQAALDAGQGKTVQFEPGTYTFAGGTPIIRSNTTVAACGQVIVVQPNPGKFAGFAIEPGSANITVDGIDIRGPWYGTGVPDWINGDMDRTLWEAAYAENIGIDIRGRWYERQILKYTKAQMEASTNVSKQITIRNCKIEGFGQSGIIADNVDGFSAEHNSIGKCGRDGIRMYGVVDSRCVYNAIKSLSPGYDGAKPNYNVYGITATRLYGNSSVPDPAVSIGRISRDVDICFNHIEDAKTWKGLDTHGGKNIRFAGNTVRNAYIAIGIDKGGIHDTHGKAPGRDITIIGNKLLWDGSTPYRRAGITAYGHDASDDLIGRNLTVTGNYITGCGGHPTDGAVSVSNFSGVSVTGNVFTDSLRAALTIWNTVHDFTFTGNVVDNVEPTMYDVAYGVLVQTRRGSGIIDGNTFRNRNQPHMNAAISLQTPDPGFGVKVGRDNLFHGSIQAKVNTVGNEAGGSYFLTPVAYANVDLTASGAALVAGKGVLSVVRSGVGAVQITLQESLSLSESLIPQMTVKNGAAASVSVSSVSAGGFTVHVTDQAFNPVDAGFYLTVVGY